MKIFSKLKMIPIAFALQFVGIHPAFAATSTTSVIGEGVAGIANLEKWVTIAFK